MTADLQTQDLVLGLELLHILSVALNASAYEVDTAQLAYKHYTTRPVCPDRVCELIQLAGPEAIPGKLGQQMYRDALWGGV